MSASTVPDDTVAVDAPVSDAYVVPYSVEPIVRSVYSVPYAVAPGAQRVGYSIPYSASPTLPSTYLAAPIVLGVGLGHAGSPVSYYTTAYGFGFSY